MSWALVAPYVVFVAAQLVEAPTLRPARSEATSRDAGSWGWTLLGVVVGLFCAEALRGWLGTSEAPVWWGSGVALAVAGTALRLWAIALLGRYFTRQVCVSADQPLIERGPYRWVRHPSYTGTLLTWLGVGLVFGSWACVAALLVPIGAGFAYRIHVEEAALRELLGTRYERYCARTWRLVPWVL